MSKDFRESFNQTMLNAAKEKNTIINIEGKEYFSVCSMPPNVEVFSAIYMKEDSSNVLDLERTIQSIFGKMNLNMIERKKNVLAGVLTSFFMRNDSLKTIQEDLYFMFYEYPIKLIQDDDEDYSFDASYVVYVNEDVLLSQVLTFVIKYGFHRAMYEQFEDFECEELAKVILTILNDNEHLTSYLFSFSIDESEKDRVLVNHRYINICEVENLFNRDNEVSGLYSSNSERQKIEYEMNNNNVYKMQVILHELFHAFIDIHNYDFVEACKRNSGNNNNVEEEVVNLLGHAMSTFIMDNPAFILYLLNNHTLAYVPSDEEARNARKLTANKSLIKFHEVLEARQNLLELQAKQSENRIEQLEKELARAEKENEKLGKDNQ